MKTKHLRVPMLYGYQIAPYLVKNRRVKDKKSAEIICFHLIAFKSNFQINVYVLYIGNALKITLFHICVCVENN